MLNSIAQRWALIKLAKPDLSNGKEWTVNRSLGGSTYPG
jgi:hypothetical protein